VKIVRYKSEDEENKVKAFEFIEIATIVNMAVQWRTTTPSRQICRRIMEIFHMAVAARFSCA
jgi:hypothetical protein